jgi:GAF domain-containing protein/HAMP domain-containing protein
MTEEGKVTMSAGHLIEGESQSRQLAPEHFHVSRVRAIRTRLLVAFVLLVLLPAVAISAVSAVTGLEAGQRRAIEQLELVAGLKEAEINDWRDSLLPGLNDALTERDTLLLARGILELDVPGANLAAALEGRFAQSIERMQLFESLFLLDLEGKTVVTTDDAQQDVVHSDQAYFQEGLRGPYVHPPFYSQSLNRVVLVVVQPVLDREEQTLGVLAGCANLAALNDIMLEQVGLGETGEVYLVAQNRALLTPLRSGEEELGANAQGADIAIESQRNGSGLYRNYAGEPVIGVYHWLPELQVALLAEQHQSEAFGATYAALGVNVGVALISVLLAVGVSLLVARGIATPLSDLTETATQIAAGDLDRMAEVEREDEIGALARAFNSMTVQLRDLIGSLEQRVVDRTRDLRAAAVVARATTSVLDLDELLPGVVELVRERLALYYVGLFLLDEEGRFAVLRAGTGEAGRQMLAQGHRLEVGGDSMIGQCMATGQARVALDVGEEAVRFDNPLLPETRSEMALPLRSRGRSIGAITVQSVEGAAFDEADIAVMQTLADQVAVAIDNARLFANAQIALQEIEAVQRRYLGQAWAEYAAARVASGYEQTDAGMVSFGDEVLPEVRQAMTEQRPVVWNADGNAEPSALVVPIMVRGQPIGALGIHDDDGSRQWTEGDVDLIEAVAERIAMAVENLRLLDETQRRAAYERLVGEVTTRMRASLDLESVLKTAMDEMYQALGLDEIVIRLATEEPRHGLA